jgi:chromosome segregation ATPase
VLAATARIGTLAQSLWIEHIVARIAALEDELANATSALLDLGQAAAHLAERRDQLMKKAADMRARREYAIARLERDEQTARRFGAMLDEEYLAELQNKQRKIAMAEKPIDALLMLLSTADIGNERRNIKLPEPTPT